MSKLVQAVMKGLYGVNLEGGHYMYRNISGNCSRIMKRLFSSEEGVTIPKHRFLIAYDFDHTLVAENTDYYVIKLAPEEELPQEIKSLYRDNNWIEYMGEVFKYLHKKGSSREDILQCVSEIPLTEGMKELLELKGENFDIDNIIISDSNSVFIKQILDCLNVSSSILQVFTNPAKFDTDGCLNIKGYHSQDWCYLSSENLCKGDILKNFLLERQKSSVEYSCVFYIGDGFNDLCPGLMLRKEDVLMPRMGFKLHSVLKEMSEKNKPVSLSNLKASVVPWSTGYDIIKHIQNLIKQS